MLYVPSVTAASVTALVQPNPDSSDFDYVRGNPRELPLVQGLPLIKPPYGRITAIDLRSGEHAWMVPNGPGPLDHPLLRDLDLPPGTVVHGAGDKASLSEGVRPSWERNRRPVIQCATEHQAVESDRAVQYARHPTDQPRLDVSVRRGGELHVADLNRIFHAS